MKIGNPYLFISAFFISANILAQNQIIPDSVIAARKKQPPSTSGGPQTIINRDQLKRAGVISLAQALQSLGGVQLQNMSGNDSATASLRGFGGNASSNVLLLVNGIPLTNPDLAAPNLNIIPLQDIEVIKIIAGSESVLYGDQAVGGVIAINTREITQPELRFSCTAGSYNMHDCTAGFQDQKKQWLYSAAFTNKRTDNYREHNHYEQNNLLGRIEYAYAQGRVDFNYQAAQESLQYPGALTAAQVRRNRRLANNSVDYFRDSNGFLQLRQTQYLNNDWRTFTTLTYRTMDGHGVLYSAFNQSRSDYFLKAETKAKIHDTEVSGGLDFQYDHYSLQSAFGVTKDAQQKYGGFALGVIPLYPTVDLSLGARLAQQQSALQGLISNDNLNRAFASTLGIKVHPCEQLDYYLRRAESFRFPKADENASTATGKGLRTQRGAAYEGGVDYRYLDYEAALDVYQLNLRDEIAYDPMQTPQDPFGTNRNLSPTIRRGFNLSLRAQPAEKWNASLQYHYVNAHFQGGVNAGKRIPLVSENILQTGIEYQLAENWFAYAEMLFTGNQYPANDDANVGGSIGGYTIFNCNLRYEKDHFNAALRLNNLTNRNYYFYTVYSPGMHTDFFYPAPGFNLSLSANYTFT